MPAPSEYDISHGDYGETMDTSFGMIPGLTFVTGFALIGFGALFTSGSVVAANGHVATVNVTFATTHPITGATVNGVATYAASSAVIAESAGALAGLKASALAGVSPMVITPLLESFGFVKIGSLASLIALSLYQPSPLQAGNYGDHGGYLGSFTPGGNAGFPGPGYPPGFPGFPGFGYANHGFGGRVCYVHNDVEYCHWEY